MKRFPFLVPSLALTLATVLGLTTVAGGRWFAHNIFSTLQFLGLVIIYLAGGLPTG